MTDLADMLRSFSVSYPKARKEQFKGHPVSTLLRKDITSLIADSGLFDQALYKVHASVGKGSWAEIPWIAIFDNCETSTLHHGLFIIIVFSSDYSSIFLSLNHGSVTHFDRHNRLETNHYLREISDTLRGLLPVETMLVGPIDLSASSSVGRFLEIGNIAAIKRNVDDNLNDDTLMSDLTRLRELYSASLQLEHDGVVTLAYPDNDI